MLIERKEHKEEDGSIGYIESVFKSGNVLQTTYFPAMRRLYIAFNRGHTYSYANITPEFYQEFEDAESQGVFFFKRINNKNEFPYRKEFTLYPNEINDIKQIVENHNKLNEDE